MGLHHVVPLDATAHTGFMPATPQPKTAVATIYVAEGVKHTRRSSFGEMWGEDRSGLAVQIKGNLNPGS